MATQRTIQLGEICRRLQIKERDARYVLEQGNVPSGVDVSPDSGTYRQFGPGQAFWMALVLKLKQAGITIPHAAKIADYAEGGLRTATQNLGQDWQFRPWMGQFDTDHQYCVEVGDLEYVRFGMDANPSGGGRFRYFDWHRIVKPGVPVKGLRPCVILRLDLTVIAQLLAGAFGQHAAS
jgi:hypothetical protein